MSRTVNGSSSILAAARVICRMVGRFGSSGVRAAFGDELADAVDLLVVACLALSETDDIVGQIDQTVPLGPEDISPGS
jgi:hypothetical protein